MPTPYWMQQPTEYPQVYWMPNDVQMDAARENRRQQEEQARAALQMLQEQALIQNPARREAVQAPPTPISDERHAEIEAIYGGQLPRTAAIRAQNRAEGEAQFRTWEQISDEIRQRVPGVDPEQFRSTYDQMLRQADIAERLSQARQRFHNNVQGLPEFIGRRLPVVGTLNAVGESRRYQDARARLEAGRPEPADYDLIARHDQNRETEAAISRTMAGSLASAASNIPTIIGEFALGGSALSGASAIPYVGAPLRAIGFGTQAASAAVPAAALGARGLSAMAARETGSFAARTALTTAAVPSMYLPQAAQNAEQFGGQWYELRNLAPAFAVGAINTAILGQIASRVGGEGLSGLLKSIGIGMGEQAIADLGTALIGTTTGNERFSTSGGLLGQAASGFRRDGMDYFRRAITGEDDLLKHAAGQAMTFAIFGLMHNGPARGERPADRSPVIQAAERVISEQARAGVGREATGRAVESVTNPFTEALRQNPEMTRPEAKEVAKRIMETIKGKNTKPLEAFADSIANTFPQYATAAKEAQKTPETTQLPKVGNAQEARTAAPTPQGEPVATQSPPVAREAGPERMTPELAAKWEAKLAEAGLGATETGLPTRARHFGELALRPEIQSLIERSSLTPREKQAIEGMTSGNSTRALKDMMGVSHETIRKEAEAAFQKMKKIDSAELVDYPTFRDFIVESMKNKADHLMEQGRSQSIEQGVSKVRPSEVAEQSRRLAESVDREANSLYAEEIRRDHEQAQRDGRNAGRTPEEIRADIEAARKEDEPVYHAERNRRRTSRAEPAAEPTPAERPAAERPAEPVKKNSALYEYADKMEKEAAAELKAKLGDVLFSGFDPTLIPPLAKLVAAKIIKTGYTLAEWTKAAVARFGDDIKPHIKDVWERAVAESQPEGIVGIKKAFTDADREAKGLRPAMEVDPVGHSFPELRERVLEIIAKDPSRPEMLVQEMKKNPRKLSDLDLDAALLLKRNVDLQNQIDAKDAKIAEARKAGNTVEVALQESGRDVLLSQLQETYDVIRKSGTDRGRALNAYKLMAERDFSLARMLSNAETAKGDHLSREERSEIHTKNKEIESLRAKIEKLEEAAAAKRAEEVAKTPDTRAEPRSRRQEVADKEIKDAWGEFMRAGKRAALFSGGIDTQMIAAAGKLAKAYVKKGVAKLADFIDEVRQQTGKPVKPELEKVLTEQWEAAQKSMADEAISKTVKGMDPANPSSVSRVAQAIAKRLVAEGVTERDALIDRVHKELAEVMPDLTRRQTMDAISGYGEYKLLSKDEVSVKLRDLKGQMQQVGKLEDMQSGQAPLKTGMERREPSAEERRLIKEVNDIKRENGFDVTDPETQLKSSLQSLKTRLTHQIEDLTRRLETGDFEQKPKTKLVLDAEATALKFKYEEAKNDFLVNLEHYRRQKRHLGEKTGDAAREAISLQRSLYLGLDLPPLLRQGAAFFWGHPIKAVSALVNTAKAFKSREAAFELIEELRQRPSYKDGTYQRDGVEFTDTHGPLNAREESFRSNLVGKIPVFAGLERWNTSFMNLVRAEYHDIMSANMAGGKASPEGGKVIANAVNVFTGRGDLGKFNQAAEALAAVFLSPRYVASRFQLLFGQPLWTSPGAETAQARKAIAIEYARSAMGLGFFFAMIGMAAKMGLDVDVELSPLSSDFGKVRLGNTRLDPLAGVQQALVLVAREAMGKTKNTNGETYSIRGDNRQFGRNDGAAVLGNFIRGKLAPIPGGAVNLMAGQNVVGESRGPGTVALDLITPISVEDIYKAMQDQGIPRGLAITLWAILGGGTQTYKRR